MGRQGLKISSLGIVTVCVALLLAVGCAGKSRRDTAVSGNVAGGMAEGPAPSDAPPNPGAGGTADVDSNGEDLAKKLANPVASLISVPFNLNYDRGYGPVGDGERAVMNIQPVVPFPLSEDLTLISRTIVPLVDQRDIAPGSGHQSGLGDILQGFFLVPSAPGPGGSIWGAGPVFLLPTASDDLLGGGKWGAGPQAVILKQSGPWTYGALANHIWSFAGDEDRADVSSTLLQPFLSYTTKDAWSISLSSESTHDWNAHQWTIPLTLGVKKVLTIGKQPVSLGASVRYWAESPDLGPDGFGGQVSLTLLFPK